MVLGQSFRITRDGVELIGQQVPLGVTPDEVLRSLLEQLASQGVAVKVLDAVKTDTGMTSGAVQVTYDGSVPTYGKGRITYTFGRTTASIGPSGSGDGALIEDLGGFGNAGDLGAVGTVLSPAPVGRRLQDRRRLRRCAPTCRRRSRLPWPGASTRRRRCSASIRSSWWWRRASSS